MVWLPVGEGSASLGWRLAACRSTNTSRRSETRTQACTPTRWSTGRHFVIVLRALFPHTIERFEEHGGAPAHHHDRHPDDCRIHNGTAASGGDREALDLTF